MTLSSWSPVQAVSALSVLLAVQCHVTGIKPALACGRYLLTSLGVDFHGI